MDAFDADVLIYAAAPDHPLGRRIAPLFSPSPEHPDSPVGVGSTLLLPEVLAKPMRDGLRQEAQVLARLLARLNLHRFDRATAEIATALAMRYRLRAADAAHLATAVAIGADRFLTNNQRDFPTSIREIDVVYPAALPAPRTD